MKEMKKCIFAGTFDPPTLGHKALVEECLKLFDEVVVAILINPAKVPCFTLEEREEIFIERAAANEEPNLFVSVNGYNCLLPKGKTSLVPRSVAAEIHRARRAQQRLDATMDALKENI